MTLIPIHVLGGAVAILSGLVALYASKGGPLHRKSGTLFVGAMLVMSLTGAVIAIGRDGAALNIPAGLVTAYLVVTVLLTVQPPSSRLREMERPAMFAAFAIAAGCLASAIVSAGRGQMGFVYPVVIFGIVALSAGVGDRRMLGAAACRGARGSDGTCGACAPRCSSRRVRSSSDRCGEFPSRCALRRCGSSRCWCW